METAYPVIFTDVGDMVLVEVPDLQILTEGNDLPDAIRMARDAIGLKGVMLMEKKKDIPKPSEIENIDKEGGTFTEGKHIKSLVDIDFEAYKRKHDNKSVRRNVTLPNWLNVAADEAGLNVSKVLQDALMSTLSVSKNRFIRRAAAMVAAL